MMSGFVMWEAHRIIAVFFDICLMLRSLFHVFFVHGARLHVLRCHLEHAEYQKREHSFHLNFFLPN
jgi:hypothetical protein